MFWFNNKPIVVDFFTKDNNVYETSKPLRANRYFPEWWKKLDKVIYPPGKPPHPSMRSCAGFLDLYRLGFMVPLWSDIQIVVDKPGEYQWAYSDQTSSASFHSNSQAGALPELARIRNLKLMTPWMARTEKSLQWNIINPSWNQNFQQDWFAPSAVVDFSKMHTMNINLFILNMDQLRSFTIPYQMPMVHYVPLTDKHIELKYHLVTPNEYDRISARVRQVSFINSYRNILSARENNRVDT